MIDSLATPSPEPALPHLRELVRGAVDRGELPDPPTAAQIRAHLRNHGTPCTVARSRRLRAELTAPPQDGTEGTFGRRLMSARLDRGLTRTELARIVDCSESYLSYLEADARSPSDRLLGALADAVRREPDWLRTGEESPTSEQVRRSLDLAWQGLQAAEWGAVEKHAAQVLDEPHERPLRIDERETAVLLRGRALCATGREEEALQLFEPLVHEVLDGNSDVDPVVLGQGYVRALLQTADEHVERLAQASIIGLHLLNAGARRRSDDWWRLAATLMGVSQRVSPVDLSVAQGEWWLAQLGTEGGLHPSGAAALYWNLALNDVDRGDTEEALRKIELGVALQDPRAFPADGAGIRTVRAYILLLARPDRAAEAIEELDECREALARHGYPASMGDWLGTRARAEAVQGRFTDALRTLDALETCTAGPHAWFEGRILRGDILDRMADRTGALQAYGSAAELAREAPRTPTWARAWRDLGDRWTRTGDPSAAAEAYRHALDLMQLAPLPGLPA